MSLEKNDLARLIHPELHVDEYSSKLGENHDVVVLSFKVDGKEPAVDLGNFIEKGYEWVLDADVSSGEMSDGDYIVFVEFPRDKQLAEHVMEIMSDIMNLTDQSLDEWRLRYYHDVADHELTKQNLQKLVPSSPEEYRRRYGHEEIDRLKTAAGVKVTTKAPKNDHTEQLRIAAGIK